MRDLNVVFARRARFRRHLRRLRPLREDLESAGLTAPSVIAILAVESFYRPRLLRALEYATWIISSLLNPRRASTLSVGIAQMQLRHWRELGLLDSIRFSPRRLAVVRDVGANYEACLRYLRACGTLHESDPGVISRSYAGGQRPYFGVMFAEALPPLPS